jgi:hypothetical protein
MIWSYPKIHAIGGRFTEKLFDNSVLVEEKCDGSSFSFRRINGELQARSKGQNIILDAPDKMFQKVVEVIRILSPHLHDGWVYRSEYLQKPKHNALAYDRIPNNHIIIFDIETDNQSYLSYEEKAAEATRLGLEVVPKMFEGRVESIEQFKSFMDRISCLGGQKIEGLVCKNYFQWGEDGKALMGKHVSESYKEVHKANWKQSNPNSGDILDRMIKSYKTPARWNKSIIHMKEDGTLTDSPKDIGPLIKRIQEDIKTECSEDIKDELFKWAIGHILRGATAGVAEYYKQKLLEKQFEGENNG